LSAHGTFAAAASLLVALAWPAHGVRAADTTSREAVRAEAASAARAGKIPRGEATEPGPPPKTSTRSRSEVKAETRAAVKAETIEHGEGRSSMETPVAPASGPTKSRAEVKAEAASALGLRAASRPAAQPRRP